MTTESISSKEPFDETAKAFYYHLFKKWGLQVETEKEVFSCLGNIDLVVTCTDTNRTHLQNTVFAHFRQLNAVELKGIHAPLTVENYFRLMMRVCGLGDQIYQEQKLAKASKDEKHSEPDLLANQLTVTIICVTRPDSILRQLKEQYRFVQTEEPGIYYCDEVLGKWIIYPSELELIPKNYPLLSLAQGKKLEQFIALCLREGLNDYLQLIIDIELATNSNAILQKIFTQKFLREMENSNMTFQIREETWPVIDKFFQQTPEVFWKLPTFRQALIAFQQQSELVGEQRLLIRFVRHKFPHVPQGIIQRIQTTFDQEQLDNWSDQIISATDLSEIDFKVPKR